MVQRLEPSRRQSQKAAKNPPRCFQNSGQIWFGIRGGQFQRGQFTA